MNAAATQPFSSRAARPGRGFGLVCVLLGPVLLGGHLLAFSAGVELEEFDGWRRLWNDLAVATATWLDARHGPPPADARLLRGAAADDFVRATVPRRIEREGLSPLRPFGVLKDGPFLRDRIAPEVRPYDDRGRSKVLGWGFRVAGGIAPFLILWLALLVALPAVAWAAVELLQAGQPVAATTYSLLLAFDPYVVETLALARYPVGFQLAAALLAVPLSVYAVLHPSPTRAGLLGRAFTGAVGLAFCVFCRSSAALLAPGFAARAIRGPVAPARAALRTLAAPALGCLVLPVAITTAGGSEAQAIGIVSLLATALALEATWPSADGGLGAEERPFATKPSSVRATGSAWREPPDRDR